MLYFVSVQKENPPQATFIVAWKDAGKLSVDGRVVATPTTNVPRPTAPVLCERRVFANFYDNNRVIRRFVDRQRTVNMK